MKTQSQNNLLGALYFYDKKKTQNMLAEHFCELHITICEDLYMVSFHDNEQQI